MNGLYGISYCLFLLIAGYFLPFLTGKRLTRILGWTITALTVCVAVIVSRHQDPLIRMLIIVVMQLLSMKVLVMIETYSGENKLTGFQWITFATGWFGMRPALFEKLPSPRLSFFSFLLKGVSRIVIGIVLLYLSWILERKYNVERFFLSQLLMLTGFSLILHFGILNISAATWRMLGVDVPELFRAPYKATSLKEFWGKRWNIAFSEMNALIAYRPLKTAIGREKALIVSFLLSGLLHEIAISFPVVSGFGLPMMYFALHALAMYLEAHSKLVQKITRHRVWSHGWVMAWLILPLPLLFHPGFIENVLMPLRALIFFKIGFYELL